MVLVHQADEAVAEQDRAAQVFRRLGPVADDEVGGARGQRALEIEVGAERAHHEPGERGLLAEGLHQPAEHQRQDVVGQGDREGLLRGGRIERAWIGEQPVQLPKGARAAARRVSARSVSTRPPLAADQQRVAEDLP